MLFDNPLFVDSGFGKSVPGEVGGWVKVGVTEGV
jgi:hypothetical protein